MLKQSKAHLREVDETYFEHLSAALGMARLLAKAGVACVLHAVVPGLCTRTASPHREWRFQDDRKSNLMNLRLVTPDGEHSRPALGPPARRQRPRLMLIESSDSQSMADRMALLRRRRSALLMLLALSALSWLLVGAAIYSAIRLTN